MAYAQPMRRLIRRIMQTIFWGWRDRHYDVSPELKFEQEYGKGHHGG